MQKRPPNYIAKKRAYEARVKPRTNDRTSSPCPTVHGWSRCPLRLGTSSLATFLASFALVLAFAFRIALALPLPLVLPDTVSEELA